MSLAVAIVAAGLAAPALAADKPRCASEVIADEAAAHTSMNSVVAHIVGAA